jgi:hypothetical protein
MKISFLSFLLSLFFILSCQSDGKAPLSAKTFTNILVDMHTAEGAAEGEFMTKKDSLLKIYYAQILKKHNASQNDFDSTLAVYSRQPAALDSIYANVIRQLEKIDTSKH